VCIGTSGNASELTPYTTFGTSPSPGAVNNTAHALKDELVCNCILIKIYPPFGFHMTLKSVTISPNPCVINHKRVFYPISSIVNLDRRKIRHRKIVTSIKP
jgi:hypothetical protein